ncbi:hypothetical protein BH23GEM9_BH23GEM9_34940 [soil metagenome]
MIRLIIPVLIGACATAPDAPLPGEPEPARARAALATVRVDNQSREPLTILYRIAGRGSAEVAIGNVAALTAAALAPVPAGEPLLLIARTATGAELALPAQAFAIDSDWTWNIHADSRFIRPQSEAAP